MSAGAGSTAGRGGGDDGAAADGARVAERQHPELAASARLIGWRSIGSPILFTIIWTSLASSIYFSLG